MKGLLILLRRGGSNSRPLGYEPNELPLLYFAMWVAKVVVLDIRSKEINILVAFPYDISDFNHFIC